jgi:hypothetical protein
MIALPILCLSHMMELGCCLKRMTSGNNSGDTMAKYDENLTWIETVNIFYSAGETIKFLPTQEGLAFGEYGLNVLDVRGIGKTFKTNYLDHDYILDNYFSIHRFVYAWRW